MDKRTLILGLFGVLAVLQVGVPFSMIIEQEGVLKSGQEFRFRTEPVDPFDAFRGRFVALRLEQNKAPKADNAALKSGQKVFAVIGVEADGFAKFTAVNTRPPQGDTPFLRSRVSYVTGNDVYLDLPIDRYYMTEKKAPLAEKLYLNHSFGESKDAYVVVVIKKGNPVIKKLYVGGKPIEEALREETQK
jgi:uncharacterized membrane-anchored protein